MMRLLSYPGFGYSPYTPQIEMKSANVDFPNSDWTLYDVSFIQSPQSDSLINWDSFEWFDEISGKSIRLRKDFYQLYSQKKMLIGVDKNEEYIKFISMPWFNHPIAGDFELDRNIPETYMPFLKIKLYYRQFDEIQFSSQKEDFLIFVGIRENSFGKKVKYGYQLNPSKPDSLVSIGLMTPLSELFPSEQGDIKTNDSSNKTLKEDKISFLTLGDKKIYILNSLMKNIYAHRFLKEINGSNSYPLVWGLKNELSVIDSLLPNFDEYLAQIKLLQYGCCRSDDGYFRNCFDYKSRIDLPIFEPVQLDNKYRLVVGSTRIYGHVEFYKFYKSKNEVLVKRPGKYATKEAGVQEDWCGVPEGYFGQGEGTRYRYDLYYHPEKRQDKVNPPYPCEYLPPAPLYPRQLSDVFENICPPSEPISPYDRIKQPVDHYLVALDTKTREVYFLSGKETYLSKATTLYRFGKSPQEPEDISKWQLPEKLTYIRDRLYRYLVDSVKEEDIVSQDEEKIILEVDGEEYGKPLKLRVHFYHATPEMLDVQVIKE